MAVANDSGADREPPQKLAAAVADLIGQDIARKGWVIGQRIGSEPDLIKRYGVSRAVMREAVRMLEREDVATTRRGPNGGLFVRAPGDSTAVRSMSHYLDFAGVGAADLYEARRALELRCVELTASRLDEAGVRRLRDHLALEAASAEGDMVESAHDFHRLIAELTGNNALLLFVQCATELAGRFSRRHPRSARDVKLTAQIRGAHGRIAEALIAGDAELARHQMGRHLDAIILSVKRSGGPGTSGLLDASSVGGDRLC